VFAGVFTSVLSEALRVHPTPIPPITRPPDAAAISHYFSAASGRAFEDGS